MDAAAQEIEGQKGETPQEDPRLEIYTAQYVEYYDRVLAETFPEFHTGQAARALELSMKLAKQRAEERIRIEDEGEIDRLTQLPTRNGFMKRFNERLLTFARRLRESDQERPITPGPIIFLDLDNFKIANDESEDKHTFGDEVLKAVGRILLQAKRPNDIVGRYGGEEFAIFLEGESLEGGLAAAERFRSKIEAGVASNQTTAGYLQTASFGIAMLPSDLTETSLQDPIFRETLFITTFRQADLALYHAKNNGRNTVGYILPDGTPTIYQDDIKT